MNNVGLITGASGGIGYELARLFVMHKIDLVLVARSSERLRHAKESLSKIGQSRIHTVAADLSRAEGVEALIDYVNEHALTVDYLVNNAGFGDYGQFVERDMSAYSEMIRLNVESLTALTHHFAGVMVRNGHGRILNVASTAGFQPDPRFAVYGATKAYVINFTEALHHELRHTGVTATVLSPGATRTAFADRADMLSARLFDGSVLSASQVAEVGFQGMMKRKLHVVPGLKNRLMALISGITPTSRLRLAVAARIMEPKRS